jgi:hypothetical protein
VSRLGLVIDVILKIPDKLPTILFQASEDAGRKRYVSGNALELPEKKLAGLTLNEARVELFCPRCCVARCSCR